MVDVSFVTLEPYEGLYCFQELMDYDLAKVIYSLVQFSEFHICNFVYQILCGVKYAHSAEVIHRDLKPSNVLVSASGKVKIADFGLARAIKSCPSMLSAMPITNYVATRWYRAPELIVRECRYGKAVDMWAVGCILGELYGRRPLMPGKDLLDQFHYMIKYLGTPPLNLAMNKLCSVPQFATPVLWDTVYPFASTKALDLLENLLQWDPRARSTVEEALDHDYFARIRQIDSEPLCEAPFILGPEENVSNLRVLQQLLVDEVEQFQRERRGE